MKPDIRLGSIPGGEYEEYRYDVIFDAYKWDPQVGNTNTVARHAVLLSKDLVSGLSCRIIPSWHETAKAGGALPN